MSNIGLSAAVLKSLSSWGVHEVILCAGARNSPIIHCLEHIQGFKVFSFFEERAASFFAIGRMMVTKRPVAVITTSGTAVAELLPATIEAYYSGLPLILLTADRPKRFRGAGAPQSIEQSQLLRQYCQETLDIEGESELGGLTLLQPTEAPLHINLCFEEPLIDQEIKEIQFATSESHSKTQDLESSRPIEEFFVQSQRPLIILGRLSQKNSLKVLTWLKTINGVIYAEGPSGLREHPELQSKSLLAGERSASLALEKKFCDGVLRIGSVPTLRAWRDLEGRFKNFPVLSLSEEKFSGLSHKPKALPLEASLELLPKILKSDKKLLEVDRRAYKFIETILAKYPRSEVSLFRGLSKEISKKDRLFIGNSLPIREWDLVAERETLKPPVLANRGANGIDGQLSTFLGAMQEETTNWGIFGDLTSLYDLSAPWALRYAPANSKLRLVVINNQGGQIFSRLFDSSLFINSHDLDFKAWAAMWKLDYQSSVEKIEIPKEFSGVLELRPDPAESKDFWDEYDQLWVNLRSEF